MNDITEGQVLIGSNSGGPVMRRVIAVHGGVVCYSRGGDRNRYCKVETFKRWIGATKAQDARSNRE